MEISSVNRDLERILFGTTDPQTDSNRTSTHSSQAIDTLIRLQTGVENVSRETSSLESLQSCVEHLKRVSDAVSGFKLATLAEIERLAAYTPGKALSVSQASIQSAIEHLHQHTPPEWTSQTAECVDGVEIRTLIGDLVPVSVFDRIRQAGTLVEYCALIRDLEGVVVPFSQFAKEVGLLNLASVHQGSTLQQDSRDVQRDVVCLNGERLVGAQVGYTAVVQVLKAVVMEVKEHVLQSNQAIETSEWEELALNQFAKTILNVGNRTNSGGNTFEVLHHYLLHPDLTIVVPDSTTEPVPIQIHIEAGPFARSVGTEMCWRWGIRVSVEGTTNYFMSDANPESEEQARLFSVEGKFKQRLVLPWPCPSYSSVWNADDDCSIKNRDLYELSGIESKGQVCLSLKPVSVNNSYSKRNASDSVQSDQSEVVSSDPKPSSHETVSMIDAEDTKESVEDNHDGEEEVIKNTNSDPDADPLFDGNRSSEAVGNVVESIDMKEESVHEVASAGHKSNAWGSDSDFDFDETDDDESQLL